jgi:hypothetical protein
MLEQIIVGTKTQQIQKKVTGVGMALNSRQVQEQRGHKEKSTSSSV